MVELQAFRRNLLRADVGLMHVSPSSPDVAQFVGEQADLEVVTLGSLLQPSLHEEGSKLRSCSCVTDRLLTFDAHTSAHETDSGHSESSATTALAEGNELA